MIRVFVTLILLPIAALPGCRKSHVETIPQYSPMLSGAALGIMRQRAASIESVRGSGTITLTDQRGNSARLDGAFVLAPPDRARVRAWKFGQAVLDVTRTADGVWIYLPREKDGDASDLRAAAGRASDAISQWLDLVAMRLAAFDRPAEVVGDTWIYSSTDADGNTTRCQIDRATLTVRKFSIVDAGGVEHLKLTLGEYETLGDVVWPTRMEAISPNGEILIESSDLGLNDGPEGAFVPPSRGVKVR